MGWQFGSSGQLSSPGRAEKLFTCNLQILSWHRKSRTDSCGHFFSPFKEAPLFSCNCIWWEEIQKSMERSQSESACRLIVYWLIGYLPWDKYNYEAIILCPSGGQKDPGTHYVLLFKFAKTVNSDGYSCSIKEEVGKLYMFHWEFNCHFVLHTSISQNLMGKWITWIFWFRRYGVGLKILCFFFFNHLTFFKF